MAITTRQVLRAIGDDNLKLYKGEGYWYFAYDEPSKNKYDTRSVLCMRLNDMPVDRWVEAGRDFLAEMQARETQLAPPDGMTVIKLGARVY